MKNNKHLLFTCLTIIWIIQTSSIIFGQNFKILDEIKIWVSYDLTFKPDSTNLDFVMNEEYTLFVGSEIFQSQSTNSLIPVLYIKDNDIDGFMKAMAKGKVPPTRFNSIHYINYPKGKITAIEKLALDEFKYEIPMNSLEWTLLTERKTIGDYLVQKAKTNFGGREWIAWFTTDIPIGAGPYLFHGLPGLIVKISDTRGHYVFELARISEPEIFKNIEISNKTFNEVTRAEFIILRNRFNKNPHANIMQSIQATGGTLTFDDPISAQRSADKAARSRNNPIELKAD
jgi:GLPGLI family protein